MIFPWNKAENISSINWREKVLHRLWFSLLFFWYLFEKMVFAGQDAWRKHPLLAGCYRRPLPGLGTAVAIFGFYLAIDYITTPRKLHEYFQRLICPTMFCIFCSCIGSTPKKFNITFSEGGDEGDSMPTATISKHQYHPPSTPIRTRIAQPSTIKTQL